MQKEINKSGVLQKARKGTGERREEYTSIRKPGAANKKAAPPIRGRFHSVKFSPKHATDIFLGDDTSKLYNDLFKAYSKYYFLINSKSTEEDFRIGVTSVKDSYDKLKYAFSLLVNSDAQFQVDKDDQGNYFFIIYQECEWTEQLHTLEVKSIIESIGNDQDLLHVFYAFLKMFSRKAGIDLWWRGDMSYAQEYLEEQILNLEDEKEGITGKEDKEYLQEQIENIQNSLAPYSSGPALNSQQLITRSMDWEPDELIEEIRSLESNHILIDLMIEGCEVCLHGKSTSNYYYNPEDGEEFNGEGLHFEQQFSIMWNDSDRVAEEYYELIDSGASEGCDFPYAWLIINSETDKVFLPDTWLPLIDKFFEHATDVVKKIFTNEQDKQTVGK